MMDGSEKLRRCRRKRPVKRFRRERRGRAARAKLNHAPSGQKQTASRNACRQQARRLLRKPEGLVGGYDRQNMAFSASKFPD